MNKQKKKEKMDIVDLYAYNNRNKKKNNIGNKIYNVTAATTTTTVTTTLNHDLFSNKQEYCSIEQLLDNVETGDIILMSGKGMISESIRMACPGQPYSHVGIVYVKRDFRYWHPGNPLPPKKHIYLLESSNQSTPKCNFTGQYKNGPKLSSLEQKLRQYEGFVAHRKLRYLGDHDKDLVVKRLNLFQTAMETFMDDTIDRPYERNLHEMINSVYGYNTPNHDGYFCTEYSAETLHALGILHPKDTTFSNNYTLYDFKGPNRLHLNKPFHYECEQFLNL